MKDQHPTAKSEAKEIDTAELRGEYSYLDYLIEKKFYAKFWRFIRIVMYIVGVLAAVLATFGVSTYHELRTELDAADSRVGQNSCSFDPQ